MGLRIHAMRFWLSVPTKASRERYTRTSNKDNCPSFDCGSKPRSPRISRDTVGSLTPIMRPRAAPDSPSKSLARVKLPCCETAHVLPLLFLSTEIFLHKYEELAPQRGCCIQQESGGTIRGHRRVKKLELLPRIFAAELSLSTHDGEPSRKLRFRQIFAENLAPTSA